MRTVFPAAILFLAVCLPVSEGASQELGLTYSSARSSHREFPAPTGFGGFVLVTINPSWQVQISLQRLAGETDKEGVVCVTYSPRIGCYPEPTHATAALTGLRGALIRTVHLGEWLRLGAGAGLSFSHVDARVRGLSGARGDLLAPNGGQIGAQGVLSAAWAPYPRFPARVIGRFTTHWVYFHTCSGEDPPQYDPFCSAGRFREFDVGLSFAF